MDQDLNLSFPSEDYYHDGSQSTLEEISKHHRFTYYKTFHFESDEFHKELIKQTQGEKIDAEAFQLGLRYKQEILSGFVVSSDVRFISEKVGYGLFAMKGISPGDFVGEYVGEIKRRDYFSSSDYLYRYPVKDAADIPYLIDAKNGNLIRFANHSKTFNMKSFLAYVEPFYHQIFLATKPIKKGEQLVYDYGNNYWYSRGVPTIF